MKAIMGFLVICGVGCTYYSTVEKTSANPSGFPNSPAVTSVLDVSGSDAGVDDGASTSDMSLPPRSLPAQFLTVWPIGDSITEGDLLVGGDYNVSGGYRTVLRRLFEAYGLDENFAGTLVGGPGAPTLPNGAHDGHSGFETVQLLLPANMQTWQAQLFYNMPIILAGTNDLNHAYDVDIAFDGGLSPGNIRAGYSPDFKFDYIADRIMTIAQIAREGCHNACNVIVMTVPPIVGKTALTAQFNAYLRTVVAGTPNVYLADIAAVLTLDDICSDGLHPNVAGYQKIGDVVFSTMASIH